MINDDVSPDAARRIEHAGMVTRMTKPNRELLRRFYGLMLGRTVPSEEIFADVPFETYFELMRIEYPRITRRTAARSSPLTKYKQLAESFPDEPAVDDRPVLRDCTVSGKRVDLAVEEIGADVQRLDVDRVKVVSGWSALSRLGELRVLATLLSNTPEVETITPSIQLDELEIRECNLATVKTLLAGTRCRRIRVHHAADAWLDLKVLSEHPDLVELCAGAAALRNIEVVAGRELTVLSLGRVPVSESLLRTLAGVAGTLCHLSLDTSGPLSPHQVPAAWPRLERFELTVHADQEDAWLDYAADHPGVAFRLMPYANVAKAKVRVEVADYYRDIEILRVDKGKMTHFELSGDLADSFGFADNSDLEDGAKRLAKEGKRRIQWSSESDTFVATAQKLDDLRWLIDALKNSR